jgi:nucleotide-binding universal stress UspA family protein
MAVNIQNWLVAVDDSISASWAFNYATTLMDKQNGHLIILNVHFEPTDIAGGYTAPNIVKDLAEVEELKSKKVLVHYGLKAQQLGVRFTLLKGMFYHTGELICQIVKRFNIRHVIVGRREVTEFKRWISGSTSKYLLENIEDCNVTIVKTPIGSTFDQTQILAEKAELIHLIHQIEDVEGEVVKPISERFAESVTETKDRIAESVIQTKDRIVEGVTETKDRIIEGVNPIKERIVESVTDTKDKLVEGAHVIKEESSRVLDEAKLAKERAALEMKVAKDCIVDEAKHVNLEAKVGKDRMKYRLVDVFAFDEKQKQYLTEDEKLTGVSVAVSSEPKILTEEKKVSAEPKVTVAVTGEPQFITGVPK